MTSFWQSSVSSIFNEYNVLDEISELKWFISICNNGYEKGHEK
jgi:hypothetical protein